MSCGCQGRTALFALRERIVNNAPSRRAQYDTDIRDTAGYLFGEQFNGKVTIFTVRTTNTAIECPKATRSLSRTISGVAVGTH